VTLRSILQPSADWLGQPSAKRVLTVALIACAGLMLYGFTVGFWRSPLMAVYVAIKLPLLIALTLLCNGLLNGLLGMLLGSGLGFRQSLFALLSSFALAALILGSLAPVTLMLAWNAPPPDSPGAVTAHAAYLLTHTFLIAFAGTTANLHLHRVLRAKAPSRGAATVTLFAWLAGNAFLGAQFSWILRPFFGSPSLQVQFLRPDPMHGTFYEAVWRSFDKVTGDGRFAAILIAILLIPPAILFLHQKHKRTRP
jgi:hypothetical protein